MIELSGRVALVTGAGPNIGRAIAVTLAKAGAYVFCNDIDPGAAEAAAKAVKDAGGRGEALPFDITNPDAVTAAVDDACARQGLINALVNNAAITIPKSILNVSVAEWRRALDVNMTGMFLCSQAIAKKLVAAGKPGAIVNIASTSGHRGRTNAFAYCSSKGGVLNMTRAMAVDLAPYGIRVNSVTPTKTGISVGALESAAIRTVDEVPLGRLGDPQEQANAVLFALSDLASFMTGEDIRMDGGALATWGARSIFDNSEHAKR
jgi:NAD(P)-dependent dehydrogenase (short-subunit alcohol dehydrogenase family)